MTNLTLLRPEEITVSEWLREIANHNAYISDLTEQSGIYISFHRLIKKVHEVSNEWRHFGIKRGSAVVLSLQSNHHLLIHILSLMNLGAVPVPISNLFALETFQHICNTVCPHAILMSRSKYEMKFLDYEEHHGPFSMSNSKLFLHTYRSVNPSLQDFFILSTSGSTGYPKAVVHQARSLICNANLHMQSLGEYGKGTYLSSLPMFYSFGLVAGVFGSLTVGNNIVFPEQPFFPHNWFNLCEKHEVTLASVTPALLKRLLETKRKFPPMLQKLTIGGDISDGEDIIRLRYIFDNDIFLTYGLSEAGPRVMTQKLNKNQDDWRTMGKPLKGIELQIRNGELLNDEWIGELWVKTPTAMLGYLENERICRSDFDEDWLKTGDICAQDSCDQIRFIDRRKNVIICGGEKLYPGIIRNVLLKHPFIEEADVSSIPDEQWGSVPAASIKLNHLELESDQALKQIKQWCKQNLRAIEVPRTITIDSKLSARKK